MTRFLMFLALSMLVFTGQARGKDTDAQASGCEDFVYETDDHDVAIYVRFVKDGELRSVTENGIRMLLLPVGKLSNLRSPEIIRTHLDACRADPNFNKRLQ